MITKEDIVIDEVTDVGTYGYFKVPLKIFGQVRFSADDEEKMGFYMETSRTLDDATIKGLNEYINWLADCKSLLEEYYLKENWHWIDEKYDGKLKDDWYDTLEMYSGTIEVLKDGFSARFACGDNMSTDHILDIEFDGKDVSDMTFDG